MNARLLLLPCLAVFAACMPPGMGYGTGGAAAPPGSAPSAANEPNAPPQAAAASTEPEAPIPTQVELHNDCPDKVLLFLGEKPGYGSGTETSIDTNTTTTEPRGPDGTVTIWIVDSSQNGITSVKVTRDIRKVSVGCKTLNAE